MKDIADENQAVKGMADPQGVFAKVDDQMLRAQNPGLTVGHDGRGGAFREPVRIDTFGEDGGGNRRINWMPVNVKV